MSSTGELEDTEWSPLNDAELDELFGGLGTWPDTNLSTDAPQSQQGEGHQATENSDGIDDEAGDLLADVERPRLDDYRTPSPIRAPYYCKNKRKTSNSDVEAASRPAGHSNTLKSPPDKPVGPFLGQHGILYGSNFQAPQPRGEIDCDRRPGCVIEQKRAAQNPVAAKDPLGQEGQQQGAIPRVERDAEMRSETGASVARESNTDEGSAETTFSVSDVAISKVNGMYVCPHPRCDFTKARPSDVRHHYRYHTPKADKKLECSGCDERFLFKGERVRHEESVHGDRTRYKHKCSDCLRQFARADNLRRHMMTCRVRRQATSSNGSIHDRQATPSRPRTIVPGPSSAGTPYAPMPNHPPTPSPSFTSSSDRPHLSSNGSYQTTSTEPTTVSRSMGSSSPLWPNQAQAPFPPMLSGPAINPLNFTLSGTQQHPIDQDVDPMVLCDELPSETPSRKPKDHHQHGRRQ